jgi:hypothetical protein
MFPAMFQLIWPSGFRGGDLKKIGQSETRWIITKCALIRKDLP